MGLKRMADLLSGRACNFKQMLNVLNAEDIMDKFKSPAIDQDGIGLEDLEAGLNQMSMPMLRIIVKNYKGATDAQGRQLHKATACAIDTIFAEMDANQNMEVGHALNSLVRDINSINL